jgi:hypothetical protein
MSIKNILGVIKLQAIMICLIVYEMPDSAILYWGIRFSGQFFRTDQHRHKKTEQNISYFQFYGHMNKKIHLSYFSTLSCSTVYNICMPGKLRTSSIPYYWIF